MEILQGQKTAIVLGASGLIGKFLVKHLLANPAYKQVKVIARSHFALKHTKLTQITIDFKRIPDFAKQISGDDLYIAFGTTLAKAGSKEAFYEIDFKYVFDISKFAALNSVNQLLLVTAAGADPAGRFFYNRVKGDLEVAVKKLPFWSTHIFQPSVLLGSRNENRIGENLAGFIGLGIDKITGGLLSKYRPIEAELVAKSMIAAAQQFKPGIHVYPNSLLQKMSKDWDRPLSQLN